MPTLVFSSFLKSQKTFRQWLPVILANWKLRKEDHEFEISLIYRASCLKTISTQGAKASYPSTLAWTANIHNLFTGKGMQEKVTLKGPTCLQAAAK